MRYGNTERRVSMAEDSHARSKHKIGGIIAIIHGVLMLTRCWSAYRSTSLRLDVVLLGFQ